MVQVADGSVAPAPPGAGVVVVAADRNAPVVVDDSTAPDGPLSPGKKLLRRVATRARRSGLRLALGVIFVFGLGSLALTARNASFSRVWHSSVSGARSSLAGGAGLLRSATRTVVPVLVHHHRDEDPQQDSAAADDSSSDSRKPSSELRSAADPVRYALLRVIGNALPPRHDPARTLQNLRFILEHERLGDAAELARHWVLNRILDPGVRAQLTALLREFGAPFTEIPFELAAYAQCPYRVVIEDEGVDRAHAPPGDKGEWATVQELSELMDAKNRYALGVNAARNAMIEIGRGLGARWILPWDQNAFLTDEAWHHIKTDLTYQDKLTAAAAAAAAPPTPELKYFLTPMDRLTQENDVVLTPAYRANPWEEPQLIFRADAAERFDERFRYGKRDKVALLVRLRVPGVWTQWGWSPWERRRTFDNVSRDIDGVTVPQTGYVVRLYSGVPGLEVEDKAAAYWRELKRGEGIISVLHGLEARVMRELFAFSPAHLRVYDAHALRAMATLYADKGSRGPLRQLTQDATAALITHARRGWTVTSNAPLDPLNRTTVFANDVDAPEAHDDAQLLRDMAYNVTALALVWQVTGEPRFAAAALDALDAWCVNQSTAMEPTLDFADMSRAAGGSDRVGAASGIRHTSVLPILLDAMRLLFSAGPVSPTTAGEKEKASQAPLGPTAKTRIVAWVERLYHYVRTAEHPLAQFRAAPSLYGLQYDLQVASMAAFLNDSQTFRYTLGTLQGRLVTMVDERGQLPPAPGVAQAAYEMLSLAAWGQALDAAQQLNMTTHLLQFDLTPDRKEETVSTAGGLLCRMVAAQIPCCRDPLADGGAAEAEGACVTLLQRAAPVHLFIYRRLVRHALPVCAALRALASCSSLAAVAVALDDVPTDELRRYSLAPYPHLLRSTTE
ncbi:hypothetical protein PybrP1_010817 [[Pythium] brassicae (nom. inval.)]|nr:hypothetical protein PybrP1_010817 [[Pythium] brassicae (nom. inval.)]